MNINKNDYTPVRLPLIQGTSSQGAFSFAKVNDYWFYAGGDFLNDTQTTFLNFCYSTDIFSNKSDLNLMYDKENMSGYKSCIESFIDKNMYGHPLIIATGTSGTQVGGKICTGWTQYYVYSNYTEPFHTVRKAKKGKAVFLAGPKGKIGRLGY